MIFCKISLVGITANPLYVLIDYKNQHSNNNCYWLSSKLLSNYICEFDSATKR